MLVHSGRPNIVLSEQGEDLIRLEVQKLIQEKVYPTSEKLLKRLIEQHEDFPIRSTSTLCKTLRHVSEMLFYVDMKERKKYHLLLLF